MMASSPPGSRPSAFAAPAGLGLALLILLAPTISRAAEERARVLQASDLFRPRDPLARNLMAALSMDGPEQGSVVFARIPVNAKFENVTFVSEGGRRYADFQLEKNAILRLDPPLRCGPTYTLACWVKLPIPGELAPIWQTDFDGVLEIFAEDKRFGFWKTHRREYLGSCGPELKGWHHVIVSSDGFRVVFYLDGQVKGSQPFTPQNGIYGIGNHPKILERNCNAIDDMLLFDRYITHDEAPRVMAARVPFGLTPYIPPPPPGELAAAPSANSTAETATASAVPAAPKPKKTLEPETILATPLQPASVFAATRDSVVSISGARGTGGAFLLKIDDAKYLVTDPHVASLGRMSGLKTLGGSAVEVGEAALAVGSDVFRVELSSAGGRPLQLIHHVDGSVATGDEVVIVSPAAPAPITGKVTVITPSLVELDAAFPPAADGSPVIHLKTGKVIGVAACVYPLKVGAKAVKDDAGAGSRRVAWRLDNTEEWQELNWIFFFAQSTEMQNIAKLTDDLNALALDLATNRRATPGLHTNPVLKDKVNAWIAACDQGKATPAVDQEFLAFLKTTCTHDVSTSGKRLSFDCYKRAMVEQARVRADLVTTFDRVIRVISELHR